MTSRGRSLHTAGSRRCRPYQGRTFLDKRFPDSGKQSVATENVVVDRRTSLELRLGQTLGPNRSGRAEKVTQKGSCP